MPVKRVAIILGVLILSVVGLSMPANAAGPQTGKVFSTQISPQEVTGFHFVINANYNDCLVIVGGSPVNSNPIWHYPCDASPQPWERWLFESQGDKFICYARDFLGNCVQLVHVFLYRLHNEETGKCIEPHNGNISSGTNIDEYDCRTGTLRQSWFVGAAPHGGFYFFNAKALDEGGKLRVIDAAPANQTLQVRLWTFNDTMAQEFFVP
jgi:hypothetical protein